MARQARPMYHEMRPRPRYGAQSSGHEIDITAAPYNAKAGNASATLSNVKAINSALANAQPLDTVVIPAGDFFVLGGIVASDKTDLTLRIDGTIVAVADFDRWPKSDQKLYSHILYFQNCSGGRAIVWLSAA